MFGVLDLSWQAGGGGHKGSSTLMLWGEEPPPPPPPCWFVIGVSFTSTYRFGINPLDQSAIYRPALEPSPHTSQDSSVGLTLCVHRAAEPLENFTLCAPLLWLIKRGSISEIFCKVSVVTVMLCSSIFTSLTDFFSLNGRCWEPF